MRAILLAVSVVALAACGEQKAAEPVKPETTEAAPVTPSIAVGEPNPAIPAVTAPEAVPALIAGTWVSIDDAKASIIVTADGKWTDMYSDGVQPETYSWRALSGVEAKAAAPAETFTPAATYLEVKRTEGTYYYELGAVDADNLEMFYTARGNRLAYTKKK